MEMLWNFFLTHEDQPRVLYMTLLNIKGYDEFGWKPMVHAAIYGARYI
jgi:hypothetical protein